MIHTIYIYIHLHIWDTIIHDSHDLYLPSLTYLGYDLVPVASHPVVGPSTGQ